MLQLHEIVLGDDTSMSLKPTAQGEEYFSFGEVHIRAVKSGDSRATAEEHVSIKKKIINWTMESKCYMLAYSYYSWVCD